MLSFEDYCHEKKNQVEEAPVKPGVKPKEEPNPIKPSVDPFKRRPMIKPGEEPKPKASILTEKYDFDFQDWDDTDISGPSMEITIDNLIGDVINMINDVMNKEAAGTGVDILSAKKQAAKAIRDLWIDKINRDLKF